MNIENAQHQQDLHHIKQMMEKSSRFISLSGLSGIAAGTCALIGAYFAHGIINESDCQSGSRKAVHYSSYDYRNNIFEYMGSKLFLIAILTFIAALIFSFLFTYLRSAKTQTPIWGSASKRLMINIAVPLVAGGIYILKLIEAESFGLIAPGCLIFYGLALVNASKYTLGEVRYLGYMQLLLGIINLWLIGYGIYFWAIGFGLMHIVYGLFMWNKYERQ